ncbi:MAG: DNA polymerase/3'-5' exonuclease PolX [Candidatus Dadabacteria bacterium]|nr:DNA polymerase/3'-5' exonuclease PolX [Candidatus Dadabacteria bacterium]MDE0663373.1 DNA polymerase/3'-5' exonuclease PolX [Candidatus Dadabacteria bacterium]
MDSVNNEIAKIFSRIADSLEILDENVFKINAYRKASRNISSMPDSLEEFDGEKELSTIPGIGKDLSQKIIEHRLTGKIAYYEEIKKQVPDELAELLDIRGVGPKFLRTLVKHFGVADIESLKETIASPDILEVDGIGKKKIEQISRSVEVFEGGKKRMRLVKAHALATEVKEKIEIIPGVLRAELAGSLRRMRETVANIDIIASADDGAGVIEKFTALAFIKEVLGRTENSTRILTQAGVRTDLLVVEPHCYGSALQNLTGSPAHNARIREIAAAKGLETDHMGIRNGNGYFVSEEEVYESLELGYIAPELREDRGEIEAARAGELPALIEIEDLRGDLHAHSTWSDGASTIRQMADKAASLGYEYIAMTDHSPSSRIAKGLSTKRLWQKKEEVEKINSEGGAVRVLMGSEVDILPDGSLDYPDEVLRELDFVVASVHSSFLMEEEEMTRRICGALENPNVDALGHPTGRLIAQREPYKVDIDAVIETARNHGKALEINSSYKRLDLKDTHARKAVEAGVKIIVSTDAHRTEHLERMIFGVGTARRGWVKKTDVVNTYGLSELLKWLASHDS